MREEMIKQSRVKMMGCRESISGIGEMREALVGDMKNIGKINEC